MLSCPVLSFVNVIQVLQDVEYYLGLQVLIRSDGSS